MGCRRVLTETGFGLASTFSRQGGREMRLILMQAGE